MASIQVHNVALQQNPDRYTADFNFHIRFDALEDIPDDLNWKLVYVGSGESDKHDQVLEDVVVGPILRGPNEFCLTAPAPDPSKIPATELLGVTVLLLVCEYQDQEFIRVGYYVNTDYGDEKLREDPPERPQPERMVRNVLTERPRVTTHTIDWHRGQHATRSPMEL
jgi:histone chaperone ASF1